MRLSILLPVRNEGINLAIMLKMLKAVVEFPHEVIVVYDAPQDDSLPIVEEVSHTYPNLRAVHNTHGRGVRNAIQTGVESALGEYVLVFAADEVGPVLAIQDMMDLMDEGCDLVSCTRYAHGGRRLGGSLLGGVLSSWANRFFGWFSGSVLTDCTTGIKMFKRDLFHGLGLSARPIGWSVAFEMSIKAQLAGWKVGEVPIVSIDRLYGGKSTFRPLPWIVEYLRWFLWGVVELRKNRLIVTRDVSVRIPLNCALKEKVGAP